VVYALMMRGWQTGRSIMGLPDVYAEDFARRVDEAAADQLTPFRDDPYMLGYLSAMSRRPGREGQLCDAILAGQESEIQKRLKARLAEADTPERRKAFVHTAFERYLEVINAAVRKHAHNHLNLGIRFGGNPDDGAVRIAKGSDVFSINIYRYAPPRATLDRVHALTGRPLLIGEFHIGVPERGLSPGLVQAMNQEERAIAYRYYVEQSAAHPAMIGTHWFQWLDQPVTGRNDGENYSIGFVDVTDQPYSELVAAAKLTHGRLLDVQGQAPPFSQKPGLRDRTPSHPCRWRNPPADDSLGLTGPRWPQTLRNPNGSAAAWRSVHAASLGSHQGAAHRRRKHCSGNCVVSRACGLVAFERANQDPTRWWCCSTPGLSSMTTSGPTSWPDNLDSVVQLNKLSNRLTVARRVAKSNAPRYVPRTESPLETGR
jgi:hypothetical protein